MNMLYTNNSSYVCNSIIALLLRKLKVLICIREGRTLSRPSYAIATERCPPNESTLLVAVSMEQPFGIYSQQNKAISTNGA